MSQLAQRLIMAAGGAKKDSTYVDDVFSTYLYNGNFGNQTLNTGIDLANEGGLVWTKRRNSSAFHVLCDTENGTGKFLQSNEPDGLINASNTLTAFNDNGHSIGGYTEMNNSGGEFAAWTFRKAPGFFDMVTWSGNDTAGRQIPHNLGSVPGCIMVKKTSGCLLYTSPSPRDRTRSRMPSSA